MLLHTITYALLRAHKMIGTTIVSRAVFSSFFLVLILNHTSSIYGRKNPPYITEFSGMFLSFPAQFSWRGFPAGSPVLSCAFYLVILFPAIATCCRQPPWRTHQRWLRPSLGIIVCCNFRHIIQTNMNYGQNKWLHALWPKQRCMVRSLYTSMHACALLSSSSVAASRMP